MCQIMDEPSHLSWSRALHLPRQIPLQLVEKVGVLPQSLLERIVFPPQRLRLENLKGVRKGQNPKS